MTYRLKRISPVLLLLLTAMAAWYISEQWFQLVLIQGKSMWPVYDTMQLVILDKRRYEPGAGDVVAFYNKNLSAVMIKRVVAVPGDAVQIKEGKLYVNGKSRNRDSITYAGLAENPIQLAADEYFVMSDNWEQGKDSRFEAVGCIRSEDMIGKILPQREGEAYAGDHFSGGNGETAKGTNPG